MTEHDFEFHARRIMLEMWNAAVNAHPQLHEDRGFPLLDLKDDLYKLTFDVEHDKAIVVKNGNTYQISGQHLRDSWY